MNGFKFDGGIGDVIGKLVVPLVVVPDLVEDNLHFFVVGNDDADDNEIEQNKRGEGFESAFILILPVIVEKKAVEYVLDTAFPFLLHLFSLFFIQLLFQPISAFKIDVGLDDQTAIFLDVIVVVLWLVL